MVGPGTGRMTYRWDSTRQILQDIFRWPGTERGAMLGTRDRTLLLESLRPPTGLPLAACRGNELHAGPDCSPDGSPRVSPSSTPTTRTVRLSADSVALLEALRRHAEKVTLFCQAGAIAVPKPEQTAPRLPRRLGHTSSGASKRRDLPPEGLGARLRVRPEAGRLPGAVPLPKPDIRPRVGHLSLPRGTAHAPEARLRAEQALRRSAAGASGDSLPDQSRPS